MNPKNKIVVAVTGASGAIYAQQLFTKLQQLNSTINDISVVFSNNAIDIWKYEIGCDYRKSVPFKIYNNNDFYAPFASGSAQYQCMIICPCSMGMLGRIASGTSDDLISRTADVMLKERKPIILVVRETPYNIIHINNMKTVTLAGGIICPASPSFYSKPKNIQELTNTVVDRVLQLAGLTVNSFTWGKK